MEKFSTNFPSHQKFISSVLIKLTIDKLVNIPDVHRLQAFTASLKTVNLLDLNVSQAFVVFNHVEDAVRLVVTQLALQRFAVDVLSIDRLKLHFLEELNDMIKLRLHAFVANVLDVAVELLNRICVIVAAITLQLGDVVVVVCGG